jgi:hypothetical protein
MVGESLLRRAVGDVCSGESSKEKLEEEEDGCTVGFKIDGHRSSPEQIVI